MGDQHARPGRLSGRVLAFSLVAVCYLYASPLFPRINNPNENVRFYLTAAIVEHGTFQIDALRSRWGWVNDAAVHDGHIYSLKAPGTSYLGVLPYAAYRAYQRASGRPFERQTALWLCRVVGVTLPMLLVLWWFQGFLRRQSSSAAMADGVLWATALGSPLYAYSTLFVSHSLAAGSALCSLLCSRAIADARPRTARAAFCAGFFASGVTFFDYHGVVLSAPLAALAAWQLRRDAKGLGWLVVGGLLPALVMMHYQASCFGSPWTPGHIYAETAKFRADHRSGLYGLVGFDLEAARSILFGVDKGLFVTAPVFLFSAWGIRLLFRRPERRAEAIAVTVMAVGLPVVVSSMLVWRGGWAVGPRFLVAVMPILGWAALLGLDGIRRRAPNVALACLVATLVAGICVAGLTSVYYPHLPREITRPLRQLVPVLLAHGYAPTNVLGVVGIHGTTSMLPLLVAFALAPVSLVVRAASVPRVALLACLLAAALLTPSLALPDAATKTHKALRFITTHWSPGGHDRAAVLSRRLCAESSAGQKLLREELARVYEREGRLREARDVGRLCPTGPR